MSCPRNIATILAVGLSVIAALHCGSSVEQHPPSSGSGGGAGTTSSSGTGGSAGGTTSSSGTAGAGGDICGGEAMVAGFVVATMEEPTHPSPDVDDYALAGILSYQGPITQPIATNPAFDQEVQIDHGDGSQSVMQYFMPSGFALPVTVNQPYTITFRQRFGFESYAVAVVITRPTSGLPPLLFVSEGGEYGRALEEEDPLMAPLKVYQLDDPACPTEPYDQCNGVIYRDLLRFDSSTGGATTELDLYQAETGTLPVFGDDFLMVNLSSTRIQPDCPDASGGRTAFFAIKQTL